MKKIYRKIKKALSFSLTSLGVFRIFLASLLIFDILGRWRFIVEHYTNDGFLPIKSLKRFTHHGQFSIHTLSGAVEYQHLLFALALIFAVLFLIGWKTRITAFLSWALLVSVQARNYMVLQSGDHYIAALMLFSIFLPVSARFSMDAFLYRRQNPDLEYRPVKRVTSMATFALILQVFFLYFMTTYWKITPANRVFWWENAESVYWALNLDHFAMPLGVFLRSLPYELLQFSSRYTLLIEGTIPTAILLSLFIYAGGRALLISCVVLLHTMLGLGMALGLFPWIAICAIVPFIPDYVWMFLRRKIDFTPIQNFFSSLADCICSFFERLVDNKVCRFFFDGVLPKRMNPAFKLDSLSTVIILVIIAFLFCANLKHMSRDLRKWAPRKLMDFGRYIKLDQRWHMFSEPPRDDGWFIIAAYLKNGEVVDLWRDGEPVTRKKPEYVYKTYFSQRWRKYMLNLRRSEHQVHRPLFLDFYCRQWNAEHTGPRKAVEVKIEYMLENTPDYGEPFNVSHLYLGQYVCGEKRYY